MLISDTLGLHRVENPSHVNTAISLHLYCPPFDNCSVFNQQTGKRSQSQVTFWSKFGQKSNRVCSSFIITSFYNKLLIKLITLFLQMCCRKFKTAAPQKTINEITRIMCIYIQIIYQDTKLLNNNLLIW